MYNSAVTTKSDIAGANIIRLTNNFERVYLYYGRQQTAEQLQDKSAILRVPELNYVWHKIYASHLFLRESSYFPENVYYKDMIWAPQILLYAGKVVTVPCATYYYRQNDASIMATTKFSAVKMQHSYAHQKWEAEFLKKHHIYENILSCKDKVIPCAARCICESRHLTFAKRRFF